MTPQIHSDRAAVVSAAVMQIIVTAAPDELQRRIEEYLRDELSDLTRQITADLESDDE